MTSIPFRASLALAAVTLVAACGGGSDGSTGPTFSDSLSAVEAGEFSSDAIEMAGQIGFGISRTGPTIGISAPAMVRAAFSRGSLAALPARVRTAAEAIPAMDWRTARSLAGVMATASEGCTVTAHGTEEGISGFVDVNGNDIPDDLYVKQDCTTTDSTGDTTVVVHVVLTQQAKEDMTALYGFRYTIGYEFTFTDEFGNTYTGVKYDASEQVDVRAQSAAHVVQTSVRGWNDIDGVRHEGSAGRSFNASFDPAGTITPGAPVGNGALTFSGRDFYTQTDGRNLSFTLGTTAPLAYSAACFASATNPPFSAGVIVGRLNNSASQAAFIVTFSGCNAYGVDYIGTVG